MPGNRNRASRGYGRNIGSNQGRPGNPGYGSGGDRPLMASVGGPLATNNLQLHDLDLELALLKRKREMIEKQHTMLVNETRFSGTSSQYGFNQAPQSYGSQSTRNFSNLYNDPPAFERFNSSQGVKRPAIDPWDNSAPKRFSAPSGPKRAPARYNEPRPSQPPPLVSSSFRNRRPAPAQSRPSFRPTKVNKPRQNTAPNKLNTYPVEERKKIVSRASDLVETPKIFVLEADKPINTKLLGRLELALGNILREMRQAYGEVEPHVGTFASPTGLRNLKQAIRERIHTIMHGKAVGSGAQIMELYRKEHPKVTDVDLLNKARESSLQTNSLAIEILKQGNPEAYFKNNYRRLLDKTLSGMFDKLETLYKNLSINKKTVQDVVDGMIIDLENALKEDKFTLEPEKESEEKATEKTSTEDTDNKTEENGAEDSKAEENAAKPEENGAKTEETNAKTEGSDAKTEESEVSTNENDAKPDASENEAKTEENGTQEAAEKPDVNGSVETKKSEKEEKPRAVNNEEYVRARFYCKLMETLLRRSLPGLLPKYKEFLVRLLNTDEAFKETKAYLVKTTNAKVDKIVSRRNAASNESPAKNTAASGEKPSLFVRVLGRPTLPKKKQMKAFLDAFEPKLIKKHRNMHNVLFVSFDKKENFDNILAKHGTTLASCRLEIKVSEKINRNKRQNPNESSENEPKSDDVEIVETAEDCIKLDESLDDQISDLLTSIREEEDKKDEGAEETENTEESENKEDTNNVTEDAEMKETADEVVAEENNTVADENDTEAADENNTEVADENKPDQAVEESAAKEETANKPEQKNVEAVKADPSTPAKGTPTRSSVRTRRASKLS